MLEVDCPCVTPEVVLKASGHVEKFTDLMVKDEKTGTCYRADHLLKDHCKEKLEKDLTLSPEKAAELKHVLAVLDDLSADELGAKIKEYGIVAPDTKNPLSDPRQLICLLKFGSIDLISLLRDSQVPGISTIILTNRWVTANHLG